MSGVIYAVIVAMWAAFLVPMWLRRHDEAAAEARSVARFSTAMRVLARRATTEPAPTARQAPMLSSEEPTVMINRRTTSTASDLLGVQVPDDDEFDRYLENSAPVRVKVMRATSGTLRRLRGSKRVARASRQATGRRSHSLAVRRQRVLLVLLTLTVVTLLLAMISVAPPLVAVAPGMLLVAYVAHLRVQARRTADIARARRVSSYAEAPPRPSAGAPTPASLDAAVAPAPASRLAMTTAHAADVFAATGSHAEESDDEFAGPRHGWQPVRVPSPTYVTAAKAVRPIRTIDLNAPGAWTSGRLVSDAVAAAARAVGERPPPVLDELADDDTTEQRAVGD